MMNEKEKNIKKGKLIALLTGSGMTAVDACKEAGVSRQTLTDWKKNDSEFLEELTKAQDDIIAIAERGLRKRILAEEKYADAVDSKGKLLNKMETTLWLLERKGEGYGLTLEHTGNIGGGLWTEDQESALKTKKTI